MLQRYFFFLPAEASQLVLVFFLSFLIGLEREELKQSGRRAFGGVRTFPLLGLVGYAIAFLSKGNLVAMLMGLFVVAAFMLVSYWFKQRYSSEAGITTEISGLVVYLMGALVHGGHIWFACTLVVANLLLLELKDLLEGLTERINGEEIAAFAKFMLLTFVILPLVPNKEMGPFAINPFKTWLVVVAVSGVSYGSYLLLKAAKGRGGVFLTGVLGGIYSSTVATVVLSKRAAHANRPHAYSGAILTASGLMYLRIVLLVAFFNRALARELAPAFLALSLIAGLSGWIWSHRPDPASDDAPQESQTHNPLQLRTAFAFAAIFLAVLVATHLAVQYLGKGGVYSLAALMGVTDVDPFIMGLTHAAGSTTTLHVALGGILIATACNNLAKAAYAWFLADRATARWAVSALAVLALLGILPLLWL